MDGWMQSTRGGHVQHAGSHVALPTACSSPLPLAPLPISPMQPFKLTVSGVEVRRVAKAWRKGTNAREFAARSAYLEAHTTHLRSCLMQADKRHSMDGQKAVSPTTCLQHVSARDPAAPFPRTVNGIDVTRRVDRDVEVICRRVGRRSESTFAASTRARHTTACAQRMRNAARQGRLYHGKQYRTRFFRVQRAMLALQHRLVQPRLHRCKHGVGVGGRARGATASRD